MCVCVCAWQSLGSTFHIISGGEDALSLFLSLFIRWRNCFPPIAFIRRFVQVLGTYLSFGVFNRHQSPVYVCVLYYDAKH